MAESLNNSNTRLFVSGLHDRINEKDIRDHFEPFGTITDIYILRNKSNKSRGCCFVGFLNKFEASNALKKCNKTYLGTKRINVKFALNKTQKHIENKQNKIASSSNLRSNINNNNNNNRDDEKSKEYQQFMRLSKTSTNIMSNNTDDLITDFLNDSDDSSEDDDIDNIDDNMNEINDDKNVIIDNLKVTEIFIRNLPFITTDSDLYKFFNEFGNILQVFIPIDDFGKSKGYGFVQFESNECIQKLYKKYRNNLNIDNNWKKDSNPMISIIFNGRNINILLSNYKYRESYYINGKEICYDDLDDELKSNLTFKELRDLKLKHNAKNDINWNTFFVPTDNILRYNAKQLNATKSELLGVSNIYNDNNDNNNNDGNMAITTTLAETSVISKTKKFLSENGIDINKFNGSKKTTVRSRNTILIKNFPFNTTSNELKTYFKKYGEITRFLLSDTKSCAIIQFVNVKNAQNAFHNLSYSKFKHLPLFLEWAPINLFNVDYKDNNNDNDNKQQMIGKKRRFNFEDDNNNDNDDNDDDDMDETKTKVIVKNIPFETKKDELMKLFGVYGKIKSLRLPRKYGGGHRGFCFIEFDTNKEAKNVFNALSESHFYGRHLVIEWEEKQKNKNKRTRIE